MSHHPASHQPASHGAASHQPDPSPPARVLTPADYGWDEERERSFAPFRADGLVPGRVVRAERGRCDVAAEVGPVRATVPPTPDAEDGLTPCTGDWVALRPATPATSATVAAVLERRTAVVRSTASRTSHSQVLAANVDTVAVAVSLANPLRHGRIERMLALAWESGATPVVVLTKADLCADPRRAAAEVAEVAPGVEVLVTSAATGEGTDALAATLSGTVVLLGPSGVGKSALGNRLLGEDRLATGAIRESDGRGRHTTAWRELLPLPHGGVLLDTPGLRGVGMHEADEGLDQTFAEITELAGSCRFADCAHTAEPDCAVLAAVESGRITRRRLDSYHRLLRENAYAASRTDARLRAEQERPKKDIARLRRAINRSGDRRV
ncbi:MAG: ribosome small subunit-dependent GTPase A [Actinomycetales bacterium]|nr:ribosome small subunit-dependent GTPase A [Actinomycetales bacterium]